MNKVVICHCNECNIAVYQQCSLSEWWLQPTSVRTICIHCVTVSWPIYGGGGEEWSMVLFADLTEVTVDPPAPRSQWAITLAARHPPPWQLRHGITDQPSDSV